MSANDRVFGVFPFPPDQKRTLRITRDQIFHFIYPILTPDLSDLNYLYISTDRLTVCTFQLGPGGAFEPPDQHPGDEVYYVLDGVLTEENPILGEIVRVHKGESLLLPKGIWHKAYNFEQTHVRILAVIAPKIFEDQLPPADYPKQQAKRYKEAQNLALAPNPVFPEWDGHGTVDDIGRWPVPGPTCRTEPLRFYHIPEHKKLLTVHGAKSPMLTKYFVSNDLCHVGEYVLPAGGISVRLSEPDSHKGDCLLFIEDGPITLFFPDSHQAFDVQKEEGMFIPEGARYQLINYTSGPVKAIFAIAPGL